MTCPDCTPAARCVFCDLITGGGGSSDRQALAVTIAPDVFATAYQAATYFRLHHPKRERKVDPWTERALREAYAAADRVLMLWGTNG